MVYAIALHVSGTFTFSLPSSSEVMVHTPPATIATEVSPPAREAGETFGLVL